MVTHMPTVMRTLHPRVNLCRLRRREPGDDNGHGASPENWAGQEMGLAAVKRTVGEPRTSVFLDLARRKGPLQANGTGCCMGHFAAAARHGYLYSVFRAACEDPIGRSPLQAVCI